MGPELEWTPEQLAELHAMEAEYMQLILAAWTAKHQLLRQLHELQKEGPKEGPDMTADPTEFMRAGAFLEWLERSNRYLSPVQVGDHWVAVQQLMYHGSLIGGRMHDDCSVTWRYCYADTGLAFRAMVEWIAGDCAGEPQGWHKRLGRPIDIPPPDVIRAASRA